MDMMTVADPDAVHAVRTFLRKQLASELKEYLLITVQTCKHDVNSSLFIICKTINQAGSLQVKENKSSEEYVFNHHNMARRSLKNIALGLCGIVFSFLILLVHLVKYSI